LLYGLLVQSANDAATVLAQNYPGGEDAFIAAMNNKAVSLGLTATHFTNASGLDAYGHYTTAHDLALIAAAAMTNPVFKKIVATQGISVSDVDFTITHELTTINQLLGVVPGLAGVKTGWTEQAGECFVAYVDRGGRQFIIVVLGSDDRFGETQQLIDWVFANFQFQLLFFVILTSRVSIILLRYIKFCNFLIFTCKKSKAIYLFFLLFLYLTGSWQLLFHFFSFFHN